MILIRPAPLSLYTINQFISAKKVPYFLGGNNLNFKYLLEEFQASEG